MIQNWMRYLVPREWSVDQALLAVNLLKQAQDAIWHVHGAVMFDVIVLERAYAEHVADYIDLEALETTRPDDPCDDDIPF